MKKGQAAMEFLMTYGWVLLVVLIAIAALAFFGVLNPSRFLPMSCNLGVGFSCVDFKVDDDMEPTTGGTQSGIDIIVQNGIGKNLDLFVVYTDTDSQECAGWFGGIALNTVDLGYGNELFADGEKKRIKIREKDQPITKNGIRCYNTDPVLILGVTSCCSSTLLTSVQIGCPPYTCQPSQLTRGSKFKANLVVNYKEAGSTLTHSRIGQIVTQVE